MSSVNVESAPIAEELAKHVESAAETLKMLSHPARLMTLCLLIDGEYTAGELERCVGLSQSALSQHLAVLRAGGVVTTRRQAQSIYYQIVPGPWLEVLRVLHGYYCHNSYSGRANRRA